MSYVDTTALKNKSVGCSTTSLPQDSIKFRLFHNLDCGASPTQQRSMHGPSLNLPFVLVRRLCFDQSVLANTGEKLNNGEILPRTKHKRPRQIP